MIPLCATCCSCASALHLCCYWLLHVCFYQSAPRLLKLQSWACWKQKPRDIMLCCSVT